MAEEKGDVDSLLSRAKAQEKEYDWLGAADSLSKVVELLPPEDILKAANVLERLGHAFHKAAMQAENSDLSKERTRRAIEFYERARGAHKRIGAANSSGWIHRCDAMIAYLGYWMASEPSEKMKLTNAAWKAEMESLEAFEKTGDFDKCLSTFNLLAIAAAMACGTREYAGKEEIVTQLMERGERYIARSSEDTDRRELARTHAILSALLEGHGLWISEPSRYKTYHGRAVDHWAKAKGLSLDGWIDDFPFFIMTCSPGCDDSESVEIAKKGLVHGERTGDRLLKGASLTYLSGDSNWKQVTAMDKDELEESHQNALRFALEANREFSIVGYMNVESQNEIWTASPYAGLYGIRAYFGGDERLERTRMAEKGVAACPEMLRLASSTGGVDIARYAHHCSSYNSITLSRLESDRARKVHLASDALEHRKKSAECSRLTTCPLSYWENGANLCLQAEIELELFKLLEEPDKKQEMLRASILHGKEGSDLCLKWIAPQETPDSGQLKVLAQWIGNLGAAHEKVGEITLDRKNFEAAAGIHEQSADVYRRAGQPSRVAESLWGAARAYDRIGEYSKASQRFLEASALFKRAASEIKQFRQLYEDYASYMEAWAEIANARYYHLRQDAGRAKECYQKASKLHETTETWRYLAPNYLAWAEVENGEDLSRKEDSKGAIGAFQRASDLFSDSKKLLKEHVDTAGSIDERENIDRLIKAADLRREYCKGRAALEEAKLLDREGDELTSCERYGDAADTFERISSISEIGQDRREIQLMMTLSKAWQTMCKAEADASPELYDDASKLFEQAKDLSVGEKAKLLALGHSRFCKALQASTKFADSGDISYHSIATQNLEGAAKYYLKAGLETDSEYAKASKLLLDAYVYMDKASKEEDETKKAKLYAMTEKVLQASASAFSKANYPKRRDQAAMLLKKVKEEKEMAVALSEVLLAPDLVSKTMELSAPMPSHESAVGLERFEHADVQVAVLARKKDLKVGEVLDLQIELVNAGKAPAQLTKIEGIAPSGFEVVAKPDGYRLEDNYIAMKGKRLDSLKTDEVSLTLKAVEAGVFIIKPSILYLDETGSYKSFETAGVEITVKELGVAGWLRGPEKKK